MFKLPFIIFLFLVNICLAQSPHGSNFKIGCENCHTTDNWKVDFQKIKFKHSETNFPLIGQHSSVDCKSCHLNLVFEGTSGECEDCHKDIHENTVGIDCARCHETTSWLVNKITEIHQMSRFPLLGAHITADCSQCHISSSNVKFEPLGIDCKACHINDFNSARNPDHVASGFSTECQDCHNINSVEWSMSEFAHDFFPLAQGHNIANCFQCHRQNTFSGLSSECITCHQSNYNSTVNPNHATLRFLTDCKQCHALSPGWRPAQFPVHNNFYELLGAHASVSNDCAACHNNDYNNTPDQCIGCHQQDYDQTNNPPHQTSGFGTDCEVCHSQGSWQPANFEHDGQYFPIYTGTHAGQWVICSDCHTVQTNYKIFECVNCHEHNQTETDSKHNGITGYIYSSVECYACHPGGTGDGFNHATSNFPLTGAHINTECKDCHVTGYAGTSSQCYSCHLANYQSSINPNHKNLSLETNCEVCHTTEPGWSPAQFPVHNNFYELLGAHASISNDCAACHNNDYNNTPNQCAWCHQQNYNQTTDPNHSASGFSTDCQSCHTTNGWEPATFDHNTSNFPLTGTHITVSCSSCHASGYTGTPTDCYSCHKTNYDSATDPNHSASGFSTDCQSCHTTNGWEPATFDHDGQYFPIYSGRHKNEWNTCADCHTVQSNFGVFECINCHEHNKSEMDSEHSGKQGYVYLSTACYNCHPDGDE